MLDPEHASGLVLEFLDSCQTIASDSSYAYDLDLPSDLCYAAEGDQLEIPLFGGVSGHSHSLDENASNGENVRV